MGLIEKRDFPGGSDGKSVCLQCGRPGFDPWVRKIPWRRKWQPTPVLLPGKSHGWRNLVGYNPWGHKGLDTTERLHFTSEAQFLSPDTPGSVSVKSTTQVHVHVQPRHLVTGWPLWPVTCPGELSLHDWEMEQQTMDLPLSTTVTTGRG